MVIVFIIPIIIILIVLFLKPAKTKPIEGGMASLEKINLNDNDQWILIRSQNINNPVLLFLHGGPGTSEMTLIRDHHSELEKYFTVVSWDQRGAGKSFLSLKDKYSMNIEQFVEDTYKLTLMLCKRFNQEKLILAGHSWGSALGVLTVKKYPHLYSSYIGIGQVVNMLKGETISYNWTMKKAIEANDKKSIAKLKKIGVPPYSGNLRESTIIQRSVLSKYGGEVYGNSNGGIFIVLKSLLKSSEYTFMDKINFFRGIFSSMELLWPQLMKVNLVETASEIEIPVYLLEGKHDYEVPSELALDYFTNLKAPEKELIWFEKSAHFLNVEEVEKFNKFFIEKIRNNQEIALT